MARRLPRARSHSFSRANANGVTRRGHPRGLRRAAVTSSRGRVAGSKSNDIPLRFPRGAGATFARAKRGAPRQTPAANGVTAHGRGKRTGTSERTSDEGGREAAALFLRLGRACLFNPTCKNSDAARGRALPACRACGRANETDARYARRRRGVSTQRATARDTPPCNALLRDGRAVDGTKKTH